MRAKSIIAITFLLTLYSCYHMSYNKYHSVDIYTGHYKDLMLAAENDDTNKMKEIVKANHLNLDYADSTLGVSLLSWCIINHKIKGYEQLLALGADPNKQDTLHKLPPPIIEAAQVQDIMDYLVSSVKFGGNVNLISTNIKGWENHTPLLGSIYSKDLNKVKFLVEKGADVNLTPVENSNPLTVALIQERMEIAKYLLSSGADINKVKFQPISGNSLSILDLLRSQQFPLDSKEHTLKMDIIEMIRKQGFNYSAYPVPKDVLEEHKNDTNYLKNY